ncbi:hypothetical protein BCV72DRAFT_255795 [Rhizopus microsporus var. microsporus]|uniref:Tc1-like transposase DDE domain-containing protein n=1 Tax=Rhizopus microsporus var. microsporus TaxID=86635 RepID=A0A1X0R6B6_RHIZD|nr:hypothetical protein BCV72DRAFT_255795 [Rhizopus microsporus var. microsporus]
MSAQISVNCTRPLIVPTKENKARGVFFYLETRHTIRITDLAGPSKSAPCQPTSKPRLTANYRKIRLRWTKEHSHFCVHGSGRSKRVVRKEEERYEERNNICGEVLWWLAYDLRMLLEAVNTNSINQEKYINILTNSLHLWLTNITPSQQRHFIFREDRASCHTDLNPLEHVWHALEKRIKKRRSSSAKECARLDVELADYLVERMK